jgi:hypothetical protein
MYSKNMLAGMLMLVEFLWTNVMNQKTFHVLRPTTRTAGKTKVQVK